MVTVDAEFYARKPLRVAFDLARSWALIAAAIAACIYRPHPAVWVGAIVVIGTQQYALQILLHDGLHRTLLSTKRSTDLLCRVLLCYPLYTALEPFRRKHLDHHKYLGDARDPDRYYHVTADKRNGWRFLAYLTGLSAFFGGVLGAARRSGDGEKSASKPGKTWLVYLDWTFLLGVHAGLAAGLGYAAGWYAYPLLWLTPFVTGVFLPQSVRSFAEHAFPEPDAVADTHRLVTFRSNILERIVFAPNNMNYHAEHHLYPQVPYYHLPRLRKHLEGTGELAGTEWRGSYLAFLWRFWRALPIETATPAGAVAE